MLGNSRGNGERVFSARYSIHLGPGTRLFEGCLPQIMDSVWPSFKDMNEATEMIFLDCVEGKSVSHLLFLLHTF